MPLWNQRSRHVFCQKHVILQNYNFPIHILQHEMKFTHACSRNLPECKNKPSRDRATLGWSTCFIAFCFGAGMVSDSTNEHICSGTPHRCFLMETSRNSCVTEAAGSFLSYFPSMQVWFESSYLRTAHSQVHPITHQHCLIGSFVNAPRRARSSRGPKDPTNCISTAKSGNVRRVGQGPSNWG